MPLESPPAFAHGQKHLVIVADDLISTATPWQAAATPARLAKKLLDHLRTDVRAIGVDDSFEMMRMLHEADPKAGALAATALGELELSWALSGLSVRAGLRELSLHLRASGVEVTFVSAMDDRYASQIVQAAVKVETPFACLGRREVAGRLECYLSAIDRARQLVQCEDSQIMLIARTPLAKVIGASIPLTVVSVGATQSAEVSPDDDPPIDLIDLAAQCDLTLGERDYVKKRIARRNRVQALRQMDSLSNELMAEYADLTGGFKIIGNSAQFGYLNEEVGESNARILNDRKKEAARGLYILELISIDAALVEIELRNWLIVHRNDSFPAEDRRTLGQIVSYAEDQGFSSDLIQRIRTFVRLRNDGVHNLSRGAISYLGLSDAYMRDPALLPDVQDFVLNSAPLIGRQSESY